jgi:hypothetical protein
VTLEAQLNHTLALTCQQGDHHPAKEFAEKLAFLLDVSRSGWQDVMPFRNPSEPTVARSAP